MGLKALLDTNAIIGLLKNDGNISQILSTYSEVYISIISILEFRSFQDLDKNDLLLFEVFLSRIIVIDLRNHDLQLINKITAIRKIKKLKLPDAIIAASSIILKADLFTADQNFIKIENLNIISWNL